MKKAIIAGVGAVMLLGGGFYGIKNVNAAANPAPVAAKADQAQHTGKRAAVLTQYKAQIHQVNQLREERLDLKKQMVQKRDQLLDLFLAAKNSGDKAKIKQAKEVRQQLKTLNGEMKPLVKDAKDERKVLKTALKNGGGSAEFGKFISTQQQVNAKMKEMVTQLDKMIEILY